MFLQQDHRSEFGCVSAANAGEEGRDGERELPETLHGDSQMAQEHKEEKSNNLKAALWLLMHF